MAEDKKKASGKSDAGTEKLEARVKKLEERLNALLSGKVELKVTDLSVAPRSKLRVACE